MLQCIEGGAKERHLVKREKAFIPVVCLTDGGALAGIARNDFASDGEAEDRREGAHHLACGAGAAANDDAPARASLFVASRLTGCDVGDEPLNVAGVDLGHPLVAEQGHHMVPEARHSVFLGARLHGLPLPFSALDDAALALVEIDLRAHLPLTPLHLKLGGWVAG